jgi:hypothetical protein
MGTLLLLFFKPLTFKPQKKLPTLKNESQTALPKLFISKSQPVDSVREFGGFTNCKIVKKYKNFGGLTSWVQL